MLQEPTETPSTPLNPMALTIEDAARMLSAAGGKTVSIDMVRKDIEAGAPVGPDGRINLVHYSAWLMKEVERIGSS